MGTAAGLVSVILCLLLYHRNTRKKIFILKQQNEIDELKAMMDGEEKERNRIAIELHDNIGGMLSAASYALSQSGNYQNYQNTNSRVNTLITDIRNEIRKTAHTLMPDVLIRESIVEAIQQYCHFIERDTGVQINFQYRGSFEHVERDVQLSLYRICQELVQNILKHAEASQVIVQLDAASDLLSLTVEDNGKGFDTEDASYKGRGLKYIENRLLLVNGKISIDTESGKGTSIYIEINR